MRKILRRRVDTDISSTAAALSARGQSSIYTGVRRLDAVSGEGSRRSSTSRPTTDILAHFQELKAQERQILNRGSRDSLSASGSTGTGAGASGQSLTAEEIRSRQERLAREEKLAAQYREQLKTRLREISESAIDLGAQKTTMTQFERQVLGSSSPKDLELLELERINGVRSLIGLPALAPPPSLSSSGGGVRQSRPGTPLYVGSSPSNIPSPYPYHQHSSAQTGHASKSGPRSYHHYSHPQSHQRSSSFGDHQPGNMASNNHLRPPLPGSHQGSTAAAAAAYIPSRDYNRSYSRQRKPTDRSPDADPKSGGGHNDGDGDDDDEVQDMDLDMEEGELVE
ncbi:hypothetical protein LPJ64_003607 [Coemansia asiatica]|uniref:Uncharacterized protein n=1 Tax=Coemansia asiatica TaxID=1052880 RepID=A0A9W8CJW2_9FUNG|nr:hypothetical protein LPJ64_003607 [Coemansia asiatica]KAJ2864536.1 hypothetical protein FB639_005196 [Coemansia asiatica]